MISADVKKNGPSSGESKKIFLKQEKYVDGQYLAAARRPNGTDSVLRRSYVESNIILDFVGQMIFRQKK